MNRNQTNCGKSGWAKWKLLFKSRLKEKRCLLLVDSSCLAVPRFGCEKTRKCQGQTEWVLETLKATIVKIPQLFYYFYGNGKQSLWTITINWKCLQSSLYSWMQRGSHSGEMISQDRQKYSPVTLEGKIDWRLAGLMIQTEEFVAT